MTFKKITITILIVALIIWTCWVLATSEEFQRCINERQKYEAYQALHEKSFFFIKALVSINLRAACAVHLADVYQGAITALSGIAVAAFTGTLWVATVGLMNAAKRQSEETRIAFISANRPKVILRRILYTPIAMDEPLDVYFVVTNVGASNAVIRYRHFHFEFRSGRGIPTYDPRADTAPVSLAAGESAELHYASRADSWESVFEDIEIKGNPIDVYWIGQIVYEDGVGIQRSTGFCRRFDRESHRWVRTDNPDEEYCD
jgi:hypothetical protein